MKSIIQKLWMGMAMLCLTISASAYDFKVDGIYYNVVSLYDLTCEVTKGDMRYSGDIKIPAEVQYKNRTLSVVAIEGNEDFFKSAFGSCTNLTSVSIPNSVIEIGKNAFCNCTALTSVTISESETKKSVTKIGERAFDRCSMLTSFIIPNSVTEIGNYAFNGCSALTSVTISDSVTEIGNYAFNGCSALTSVTIPDSVKTIREGLFYDCSSLTSVSIPESIFYIRDEAFYGCSALTTIIIPDSVESIGDYAFVNCKSLKSIMLGKSLDYIGNGVFEGCKNLESIEFPGNVNYIDWVPINYSSNYSKHYDNTLGEHTCFEFTYCSNLKEIKFLYGEEPLYVNYFCGFPIENLYIDRDLIWEYEITRHSEFCLKNVKYLSIGPHIQEFSIGYNMSMSQLEGLVSLQCYSLLPPVIGKFSNAQYINLTVKVPYEALEAYKQADVWKNFWNLEGFDASGVYEIKNEQIHKREVGRYDLNGRPVSEDFDGISIIKYSDGSTKKFLSGFYMTEK